MITMEIRCAYINICKSAKGKVNRCYKCKHNTLRNKVYDFFEEANDNPIPDECPLLHYSGPAEQTPGYKCPVCGEYTNPYHLCDDLCSSCGYKLRTK